MMTNRLHRPIKVEGSTTKVSTSCGNIYITINTIDNKPMEVFLNIGKAGGCAASQMESLGRIVSLGLQGNVDVEDIIKGLDGIRCHIPKGDVLSCADAVAKTLQKESKIIKKEE